MQGVMRWRRHAIVLIALRQGGHSVIAALNKGHGKYGILSPAAKLQSLVLSKHPSTHFLWTQRPTLTMALMHLQALCCSQQNIRAC